MYRFLKNFKNNKKKSFKLTQNQTQEIIEMAKEKIEEEKIQRELIYILEKFPEICEFILELNNRIKRLEETDNLCI